MLSPREWNLWRVLRVMVLKVTRGPGDKLICPPSLKVLIIILRDMMKTEPFTSRCYYWNTLIFKYSQLETLGFPVFRSGGCTAAWPFGRSEPGAPSTSMARYTFKGIY